MSKLGYARESLRNAVHQYVLRRFMMEAKKRNMTRAEMARRLGKKPEQITRWLGAPGNWTLDTVSDILLSMGFDPDDIIMGNGSAIPHNFAHELVDRWALSDAFSHFSRPSGAASGSVIKPRQKPSPQAEARNALGVNNARYGCHGKAKKLAMEGMP